MASSPPIADMEPSALGDWLLEKYGLEYQEDIDKFKKAKINGRVFLDLPEREDILKELNLSPGFKHLVLQKAKELKKSIDADTADLVTPGNGAVAVTPSNGASLPPVRIPLCTSENLDEEDSDCSLTDPDCKDTQEGVLSAWVPKNVIWKGRKELGVKFLNTIPSDWTYKGNGMNIGNIMSWANEWSLRGNGVIPTFTHIEDPGALSDIRVEFTSDGRTRSKVGTRAEGAKNNEATMWLGLNTGTNEYKKHLVVHEFGHALGLGHEHQRSDFWKNIKPYVNTEKMKDDLNVSDTNFEQNWCRDGDFKRRKKCTPYDPNSVMHYWFKKDWLTNGYSDKSKVEGDRSLSAKVKASLLGVHERHEKVANQPSEQDIQLLTKLYAESGRGMSGPPPSITMREDSDEQGGATADSGKLPDDPIWSQVPTLGYLQLLRWSDSGGQIKYFYLLHHLAPHWDSVATTLHLTTADIKIIEKNKCSDQFGRIRDVFDKWLSNGSRLPEAKRYPVSWRGVYHLLQDIHKWDTATNLKSALSANKSNIRKTI